MPRLPQHLSRAPVGKEQLPREALAGFQRDRILRAATGVFAKRGYQQTTVDNIVAAAKTSVGAFYQQFEGKEDCFLAVFERIIAGEGERIEAALGSEASWPDRAYSALRELLEAFVDDPLAARIVLIEAQTAGGAATARYNELIDAAVAWLRRGRRLHPAAAQLPESFEQAAVSGTAYFLQQRLLASSRSSVETLLAETSPLVLEPIVGAGEIRRLQA